MNAGPIVPDVPTPQLHTAITPQPDPHGFAKALDQYGAALNRADDAEEAFASGSGDLTAAIYERARADVALSVATATAQRVAQALQALFNMQV